MRISIVRLPLGHRNLGNLDAFISSFKDVNEFPNELRWSLCPVRPANKGALDYAASTPKTAPFSRENLYNHSTTIQPLIC